MSQESTHITPLRLHDLMAAERNLEKARAVLGLVRPYVENAATSLHDGSDGDGIRKAAKARLASIDALEPIPLYNEIAAELEKAKAKIRELEAMLTTAHEIKSVQHKRLEFDGGSTPREKAFLESFLKDDEKYTEQGQMCLIAALLSVPWVRHPLGPATKRDRIVAATVIQWLGSKTGFLFLQDALRKCGHEITPKADYVALPHPLVAEHEQANVPDLNEPSGLETLRSLVEEHDMTGKDLGALLGVSTSIACRILKGKRRLTMDHVKTMSKHFKLSPSAFF